MLNSISPNPESPPQSERQSASQIFWADIVGIRKFLIGVIENEERDICNRMAAARQLSELHDSWVVSNEFEETAARQWKDGQTEKEALGRRAPHAIMINVAQEQDFADVAEAPEKGVSLALATSDFATPNACVYHVDGKKLDEVMRGDIFREDGRGNWLLIYRDEAA